MRELDVTPTCQAIDQIIDNLEVIVKELKQYRMTISEKNDLTNEHLNKIKQLIDEFLV